MSLEKLFLLGVASPEGVPPFTLELSGSHLLGDRKVTLQTPGEGQSVLSCSEILKQLLKGTSCHLPRGVLLSFHAQYASREFFSQIG